MPAKKYLPEATVRALHRQYADDFTPVRDLAAEYRLSVPTVYRMFRDLDLPLRVTEIERGPYEPADPESAD